ncbi:uncharacterized protein LOC126755832 [Bactrocera neohumeralis]|uniref:uncharacterized protein LOC126755832 n=1 Tax=Bactrocera neohumeralis TaxID=98809 RepID=UPI002165ABF0|nr:uncharacterized protein LOC126755832 [Bactrocera neohumeralis]
MSARAYNTGQRLYNIAVVIATLYFLQLFGDCLCIEKFTNVQCSSFDEKFATFEMCRLRAVKRDVNELSVALKFVQSNETMRNATIRLQLMKKASGYKPFLYDVTVNLCEYLEKRNHPFLNIIFNAFGNHSTSLQRCPLRNELAIEHLQFPTGMLQGLPLPLGEYAIFASLTTESKKRVEVKLYFMLNDTFKYKNLQRGDSSK